MSDLTVFTDQASVTMSKLMEMSQARQGVISNNIANANTPGFVRQQMSFRAEMSRALDQGDMTALQNVEGSLSSDLTNTPGLDGNNIAISEEMNEMMQNGVLYNLLSKAFTSRMNILKSAIKGP